jgi:iron only hydrogenase large subunit-like protein
METGHFHHALKIVKEACIGCSHCMTICPTEAIRVSEGKAYLLENRCVDCGNCFRKCPVNAIIIEQDDFSHIFDFAHRVALVPSVLIGQFPENISTDIIYKVLHDLGFTYVLEVEQSAEIISQVYQEFLKGEGIPKPLISSFCPAIVRLIQVKFPSLVDNIALIKAPIDVTALYAKKQLMDKGIDESGIGIFYITPCAAKIAAIKSPVGETKSVIDGVINMDSIYNRVYATLKKSSSTMYTGMTDRGHLNKKQILWTLTNGEAKYAEGRALAIDEIHNVIEFLEKIESEEVTKVDFLELRACDESCAGGVLVSSNRFLTAERLKKRATLAAMREENHHEDFKSEISSYSSFLKENVALHPVKPRSMVKLDEDMSAALKKMNRVRDIMNNLPLVDCSVCGAPNCNALAEDIVQDKANINRCIFVQKANEYYGIQDSDESFHLLADIWGKEKLDKPVV